MTNNGGKAPKGCTVYMEGKTKIVWQQIGETKFGMVQNKPFVTAGDGKHKEYVPEKDVFVTSAACNIFSLLNRRGIPTHYHGKMDNSMYCVRLLTMIPIEIVVRRIAFGSYLERNPETAEGMIFERPLAEFFYKKDLLSDPIMRWHAPHQCFQLYHPHEPPEKRNHIGELNAASDSFIPHNEAEIERLQTVATDAFLVLEKAFKNVNATLVDFKIECGYDKNRNLYVGDQIDGDSCRLWMGGDKTKAVDKDRYRGLAKQGLLAPKERELIADDYRRFAEMTAAFSNF